MKLAAGCWEATLAPHLGGAITRLQRAGRDVLRPARAGATDPFELGSFALLPYANRIADGRFETEGVRHHLAPNHAGQDHPLHGVGWLSPWRVAKADAISATLLHTRHGDAAWPWAYRAEQRLALNQNGLSIELDITNGDTRAMPVSLGFHPYFAAADVRSVQFAADGVWLCDAQCLPTRLAPADTLADWAAGASVERDTLIDNSYTGWSGTARIVRADGDLLLTGDNTPVLHLYVPPNERHFCVEPATSMPDAFNRAMPILLRPGETHRIGMAIRSA